MDKAKLFEALRAKNSGVFGTSLSTQQVAGVEAILDACAKYGVTDIHHVAECLAEPYHETGGYMLPIKETVMPHHKDKNPSDATVIKRLDAAFAKGQLPWVKTPYWRGGWFGRGQLQTTHEKNYIKVGKAIGVDLVSNKDKILEPAVGAAAAVVGMRDGLYTGKKLSDFDYPAEVKRAAATGEYRPRRMVNGKDGTDQKMAGLHTSFYNALVSAGYGNAPKVPKPAPAPSLPETGPIPAPRPVQSAPNPVTPPPKPSQPSGFAAILAAILKLFGGKK